MYLETSLVILVAILILLIISCVPILLQMWRILKDVKVALETFNQSLPAIMKNLEEIAANVNASSALINKQIHNFNNSSNVSQLLTSDIFSNLQYVVPMVMKLPVFRMIRTGMAVAKGLRVFVEVLLNKERA